MNYISGTNAFYASIWTNNNGLPGSQVANAYCSGLAAVDFPNLVTISGISGVTLKGGQSYFMILGPINLADNTDLAWNWNNQGVNGLDLFSTNGGNTWMNNGTGNPLGAFDIRGTPDVGGR